MVDISRQIDLGGMTIIGSVLQVGSTNAGATGTDITLSGSPVSSNYVTIATSQTVGAVKTITGSIVGAGGATAAIVMATTGAFGYATGAGGSVTQGTSGVTGVTLSKPTGVIDLFAQSLATQTGYSFALTNTVLGANDNVIVNPMTSAMGALGLAINVVPASGAATVVVRNTTAASVLSTGTIQIGVIKGVTA